MWGGGGGAGWCFVFFFFFQAEDGIRDIGVTGVQTCALPIFNPVHPQVSALLTGILQGHNRDVALLSPVTVLILTIIDTVKL